MNSLIYINSELFINLKRKNKKYCDVVGKWSSLFNRISEKTWFSFVICYILNNSLLHRIV